MGEVVGRAGHGIERAHDRAGCDVGGDPVHHGGGVLVDDGLTRALRAHEHVAQEGFGRGQGLHHT